TVGRLSRAVRTALESRPTLQRPELSWRDEVRCLELDDAARRSVRRRRTTQLEYPEASEEVSFKGTMTLIGCGILWGIILLAILSHWVPWLGWVVGPLLGVFLLLQLLRWIIPARETTGGVPASGGREPPVPTTTGADPLAREGPELAQGPQP